MKTLSDTFIDDVNEELERITPILDKRYEEIRAPEFTGRALSWQDICSEFFQQLRKAVTERSQESRNNRLVELVALVAYYYSDDSDTEEE